MVIMVPALTAITHLCYFLTFGFMCILFIACILLVLFFMPHYLSDLFLLRINWLRIQIFVFWVW